MDGWYVMTAAVESRWLFFLAYVGLLLVILRMIACCFENRQDAEGAALII